jgi:hypothetical protein
MAWRSDDADWSVRGSVSEGQSCTEVNNHDTRTTDDRQTDRRTDDRRTDRTWALLVYFNSIDPLVSFSLLVESCTGNDSLLTHIYLLQCYGLILFESRQVRVATQVGARRLLYG